MCPPFRVIQNRHSDPHALVISHLSCCPFRLPPARWAVIPGDRSRVISEVSMSQGSAVAADHGSRHGGGEFPALGWLS
jgi:hypothetical protein